MRLRALLLTSLLSACPDSPETDDARLKAGVKRLEAMRLADAPDAQEPAPLDLGRALLSTDELKVEAAERAVVSESEALAVALHRDGVAAHEPELTALADLPHARANVKLAVARVLVAAAKESLLRMDASSASRYARRALDIDEAQSGAYAVLGEVAFQQGDAAQALQLFDTGLLRDPLDAELKALAERRRQEAPAAQQAKKGSEHFTVSLEGGADDDAAAFTLDTLEEAYRAVGALFDLYPDEKVAVLLYPSRPFDAAHRHAAWAAGSYDGKLRLATAGALAQKANFRATLFHEYAHVLFHRATGGAPAPAWLNEGLAELAADKAGPGTEVACASGHGFPLHTLEKSFALLEQRQAKSAYLEARHAVERLLSRYTFAKVRALLVALKTRQDFDRAFDKTMGQSVSVFGSAFDAEAP